MHIYHNLYCDAVTEPQKRKIIRKIKYRGGLGKIYVITVSGGDDYFDLIPGYVFKQKAYPTKGIHIVGFASGYESALELVQQIIGDFSEHYQTYRFKNSFMQEKEMYFTGYHRKY